MYEFTLALKGEFKGQSYRILVVLHSIDSSGENCQTETLLLHRSEPEHSELVSCCVYSRTVCVCVHAFKCVSACVYVVVKVLGVWLLSVASSIKQGPEVCVRVTNDVTCVSAD